MNLDRTKQLLHDGIDKDNPITSLIHVLESALELVALPDNDFVWSHWNSAADAFEEINSLINRTKSGSLPERLSVSVLFAPTGSLQEVSINSGWGDAFLKVAEKYDEVERLLWPTNPWGNIDSR